MRTIRTLFENIHGIVERHLMLWLVAAFVAAIFWPQMGLQCRAPFATESMASPIHLMLASLLLTLGLSTTWSRAGELTGQLRWVALSLAIRAGLCLAVAGLLRWLPADMTLAGIGGILVLAMPAAASSSGWCLQLRSSPSVCLALIVGTTIASAIFVPVLLTVSRLLAPAGASELLGALRSAYDLRFVLPWVVLPIMLGMTIGSVHSGLADRLHAIGRAASPYLLLLLNYANGSSSLPQLRGADMTLPLPLVLAVIGCASLFVVTTVVTRRTARLPESTPAQQLSTVLGTSMSNTGLALVVATIAAPSALGLHVVVITYTLVQHLGVAAMAKWDAQRPQPVSPRQQGVTVY